MCFVLFSTLDGTQIIDIITFITEITVAYGIQQVYMFTYYRESKSYNGPFKPLKALLNPHSY